MIGRVSLLLAGSAATILVSGALALAPNAASCQELPPRRPRRALVNAAREAIGAPIVWEREGLTGRGTALCVVDTGVDSRHPDFLDPTGASRIRWWLDVRSAPRGTHAALEAIGGGAVYGPGEIEIVSEDRHGHGTSVASAAVGHDRPGRAPGPFAGVAPEAAILVVRADRPEHPGRFTDEDVVQGVRFCRAAAERDEALSPERTVVLLALGGHDGAHDGSGAYERALEAEADGVHVVVAAGNEGDLPIRAGGRSLEGYAASVELDLPSAIAGFGVVLTLDVRAEESSVHLWLRSPSGARREIAEWRPDGSVGARPPLMMAGAPVEIAGSPDRPSLVYLFIGPTAGGRMPGGTWNLELEGAGRFEIWLIDDDLESLFQPSLGGPYATFDGQIGIPATAPNLLTIGASLSRRTVTTEAETLRTEGAVGDPLIISSVGPTQSGHPKPDLLAPGGWIVTALSGDLVDGDRDNIAEGRLERIRVESGRAASWGTSLAAAIAAGGLLLVLEDAPMTPAEARASMVASADGEGWRPDAGAGVLDLPALLAARRSTPAGVDPRRSRVGFSRRSHVPGRTLHLWARGRDAEGVPSGALLVARRPGGATFSTPLRFGVGTLQFQPGRTLAGEALEIEVEIDGQPLRPLEVPIRIDDVGPFRIAGPAGGGCGATSARGSARGWLLALALLFVLRRRSR